MSLTERQKLLEQRKAQYPGILAPFPKWTRAQRKAAHLEAAAVVGKGQPQDSEPSSADSETPPPDGSQT